MQARQTAALLAGADAGAGADPSVVAGAVWRAVTARRPQTHYATGGGARPLLALRWLMPDRAFDAVMPAAAARMGRGAAVDGASAGDARPDSRPDAWAAAGRPSATPSARQETRDDGAGRPGRGRPGYRASTVGRPGTGRVALVTGASTGAAVVATDDASYVVGARLADAG